MFFVHTFACCVSPDVVCVWQAAWPRCSRLRRFTIRLVYASCAVSHGLADVSVCMSVCLRVCVCVYACICVIVRVSVQAHDAPLLLERLCFNASAKLFDAPWVVQDASKSFHGLCDLHSENYVLRWLGPSSSPAL